MKPYCWNGNNDFFIVCTVASLSWFDISSKRKKKSTGSVSLSIFRFITSHIDIPMFNSLKGILHVSEYHAALVVTAE